MKNTDNVDNDRASGNVLAFNVDERRQALSKKHKEAFCGVTTAWGISSQEAQLLAGISEKKDFDKWFDGSNFVMNDEQLTRIELMKAIYINLHMAYGNGLADAWVGLPNKGHMFSGGSALIHMTTGGIPAMQEVLRLVESRAAAA